jgi:hypothetical protein
MFGVLKDRFGCVKLSGEKRRHKIDERRAVAMMAEGNVYDALGIYEQKGSIRWASTQAEAQAALVTQWAKDSAAAPDKPRFVIAYTDEEVAMLNATLRSVRKQRGELGEEHAFDTAHGRQVFAAGDRIQFTATDKTVQLVNGTTGRIERIVDSTITVNLDSKTDRSISFDATSFTQYRHGYAGTNYRRQGRMLHQVYLYHSVTWCSTTNSITLTRLHEKMMLFISRDTAADVAQLARQMPWVNKRRGTSMLCTQQTVAPVQLLTARAMMDRWLRHELQPTHVQHGTLSRERGDRDASCVITHSEDDRLRDEEQQQARLRRDLELIWEREQEQEQDFEM